MEEKSATALASADKQQTALDAASLAFWQPALEAMSAEVRRKELLRQSQIGERILSRSSTMPSANRISAGSEHAP